jgi:hypothetical protein
MAGSAQLMASSLLSRSELVAVPDRQSCPYDSYRMLTPYLFERHLPGPRVKEEG